VTPEALIETAADYFVRVRQSRGGTGESFAWRERERGGRPGDLNAWMNIVHEPDGLERITEILQGVEIRCGDGIELIGSMSQDPSVLAYLDPPYPHSTRIVKDAYGPFEMSMEQHQQLAELANAASCAIAISGYHCTEYDAWYRDWTTHEFEMPMVRRGWCRSYVNRLVFNRSETGGGQTAPALFRVRSIQGPQWSDRLCIVLVLVASAVSLASEAETIGKQRGEIDVASLVGCLTVSRTASGKPFGNDAVIPFSGFRGIVLAQVVILAGNRDDGLTRRFVKTVRRVAGAELRHVRTSRVSSKRYVPNGIRSLLRNRKSCACTSAERSMVSESVPAPPATVNSNPGVMVSSSVTRMSSLPLPPERLTDCTAPRSRTSTADCASPNCPRKTSALLKGMAADPRCRSDAVNTYCSVDVAGLLSVNPNVSFPVLKLMVVCELRNPRLCRSTRSSPPRMSSANRSPGVP
jgi:hypothetical protein